MKPKTIRWRLILSYAGIALLTALLLGSIMLTMVKRYYINQEIEYLHMNAEMIGSSLGHAQSVGVSGESLASMVDQLAFFTNLQIRLMDINGNQIHDSGLPETNTMLAFNSSGVITLYDDVQFSDEENLLTDAIAEDGVVLLEGGFMELPGFFMENMGEEVVSDVSAEGMISLVRSKEIHLQEYSSSTGISLGMIELSNGPAYGWFITRSVAQGWLVAAVCAVILAGLAGFLVSRVYTKPLEQLTETTSQMAEGDLSARSDMDRRDEFGVLARSFNKMAENIEKQVNNLHRFVSDASHELHSPLTVMRSNLEMMEKEESKPVLDQVHRMDQLTRNLLSLSRLDAGTYQKAQQVNFQNTVQVLLELYSSQAEQKEIVFTTEFAGDSREIMGIEPLLASAVRNLLDNAIKFTPEGGSIKLSMWNTVDAVHLKIINNGIGIQEDDLPHLFSRFHRGRNASAYEGSGLGLAIVKTIVEQHNGEISASQDGEWTSFEIVILNSRD